ncbi:hypothetical protein ABT033_22560 [Streptomyces pharetrae]|uniref:hypothetical protein n=1 Tax=Streptomyces pharetrae TaxID=291370 RepID=UPI00334DA7A5
MRSATAASLLAAGLLLAAGGTAAAQAFGTDASTGSTMDSPAAVQDVAEGVDVEEIQVGLVNAQELLSADATTVNPFVQSDSFGSTGDQAGSANAFTDGLND